MKPSFENPLLSAALLLSATIAASAADLYWDADGDTTAATGGPGIWHTTNTWRDGSDIGTLGDWADGTSPYQHRSLRRNATAAGNMALKATSPSTKSNSSSAPTVARRTTTRLNRLGFRGTITFGGTYDSTTPAIDASGLANVTGGATVTAKITGTIIGGLYIKANNNMFAGYTTGTLRPDLSRERPSTISSATSPSTAAVSCTWSSLGDPANKIILSRRWPLRQCQHRRGPTTSPATSKSPRRRDWEVLPEEPTMAVIMKLAAGKTISGSGNLTRYRSASALGSGCKEEVWLLGDMSGYTGTFENNKGDTLIQTAATSAGAWKLTGGTIKLNTTDDTHIADGSGKSDLLMNGGTLNMNGKNETINGLDGSTGTVQNQLAATTSTLTVGAGDATASFGGVIRNNTTSGGKMALVKTGSGEQTLAGANLYTGDTTVTAGALTLDPSGSLRFAPTTTGVSNKLTGAGTANLNGTLNLDLNAAVATVGNSWTLVDVATANYALVGITSTPALTFTQAGSLWTAPAGLVIWKFNQTTGVLSVEAANTYAKLAHRQPARHRLQHGLRQRRRPQRRGKRPGHQPQFIQRRAHTSHRHRISATFKHTLNPTLASDVSYTYEWSTDLAEWKTSGATNTGGTTATITPSAQASGVVTVTTAITSGPAAKLFTRIKATQP